MHCEQDIEDDAVHILLAYTNLETARITAGTKILEQWLQEGEPYVEEMGLRSLRNSCAPQ